MRLPYDLIVDTSSKSVFSNSVEYCDQFEKLSGGTARIAPVPYEENSIIPSRDWRHAGETPVASRPTKGRHFVALVNLEPIARVLWDLNCINRANIRDAAHLRAFRLWYDELLEPYLNERWGIVEGLQYNGGYSSEPDMDTTTVSLKTGNRIGIHIDTWEGYGWTDRALAKYRFSVNVGFEDRFFVFTSKTSSEFPIENSKSEVYRGREIRAGTPSFRARIKDGDIRFIRLRLPPGYGYLAPTEHIFHDGSTHGIYEATAMFSMRGFFQGSKKCWWEH